MKKFLILMLLSGSAFANQYGIIVDNKGVDANQLSADLHQCEQLASQVKKDTNGGLIAGAATGAVKGAAVGAAAGAISGNSGSSGAKAGSAVGVVGGALSRDANRRSAESDHKEAQASVMRNCMQGRGYKTLN